MSHELKGPVSLSRTLFKKSTHFFVIRVNLDFFRLTLEKGAEAHRNLLDQHKRKSRHQSLCVGFYGRSGGTSIGAFPQDPAGSW